MEMYLTPGPEAPTDKQSVLEAFRQAGLEPVPEDEGEFWVVPFSGSGIFINFQERDGTLTFASLDIPMAEQDLGHTVFCTLEDLGWEADEDAG